jgi:hypothetical protein
MLMRVETEVQPEVAPFNMIDAALRGIPEFAFLADAIRAHHAEPDNPTRLLFSLDFLHTNQLPDGSWQHGTWHTALALIALRIGGLPLAEPVVQRGVNFLIDSQRPCGSWKEELWETAYAAAALKHLVDCCDPTEVRERRRLEDCLTKALVWLEIEIQERVVEKTVTSYELDRCVYVFSKVEESQQHVPRLFRELLTLGTRQNGKFYWNESVIDTATALRATIAAIACLPEESRKAIVEGRTIDEILAYLAYDLTGGIALTERLERIRRHGWGDSTHTAEVVLAIHELLQLGKTVSLHHELAEQLLEAGAEHLARRQNLTDGGWFSRVETTAKIAWFIAKRFGDINQSKVTVPAMPLVRLAAALKGDRDRLAWELLNYRKTRIEQTPEYRRVEKFVAAFYRVRILAMVLCVITGILLAVCFWLAKKDQGIIITSVILGPLVR